MLPTLQAAIAAGMSAITAAATGALQISSPSKLFKNLVGKNIALGIGVGIMDEMPNLMANTKKQMAMLTNVVSQSSRLSPAANAIGSMNNAQFAGIQAQMNDIKQVQQSQPPYLLEARGTIRDVFTALGIELRRVDSLNGG